MKKNVLISFVTEADTDLDAILELRKVMYKFPKSVLEKFEAFEVLDVE